MSGPTPVPDSPLHLAPAEAVDDEMIDPDAAVRELEEPGAALGRLWREYKLTADPGIREQLILQYAPLVRYVAGRVGVGLPASVEQGDLVSYGVFGLIDAIEK